MEILGIGPLELLLILVLALIFVGPAQLPQIMAQIGRAIGDFRRATSQLSDEFNRTIQAEINETRQVVEETRAVLNDARSTVTETHTAVTAAVTAPITAPQRVAVPAAESVPAAVNGTTGEPHVETNGSSSVNSVVSPPLADTSQWSWETSPATPPAPEPAAPPTPAPPAASEPAPPPPTVHSARERGPLRDELVPPY